jgi:prepilin-type N-terminal cleavage/methylation domain-containing protein
MESDTPRRGEDRGAGQRRAFTLIELVVVLTIIAVMIGMAVPRFDRAIEQSRADVAMSHLRAIWAAQRLYWLEYHAYADQLTHAASPVGLVELGLLDPQVVSADGDYTYALPSAGADAFQATATRRAGVRWSGEFTIDQTGLLGGTISADDEADIVPTIQ